MTVPVPSQLVYSDSGDGVTTTFSFPVRFLDKAEVVVLLRDVATGVDTKQVLGSDYTIAGSSWPTGGNIVFNTAPPVGTEVIRYRETVAKQVVDLANTQRNDAEAVETQLDRLAMVQQDQKQELARALKADFGEDGLTVERVAEGHFWLAGPGGRMVDGGSAEDIINAQGYAAEAKDAQAAAEAAQQGAEDAALDAALDADRAQSYAAMLSADKVKFQTVAGLIADEVMSYAAGAGLIEVGAGDIIEAQGYRYEVAADDAADHHVETAGGVKLYVLPLEDGSVSIVQFADSSTFFVEGSAFTDACNAAIRFQNTRGGGIVNVPNLGDQYVAGDASLTTGLGTFGRHIYMRPNVTVQFAPGVRIYNRATGMAETYFQYMDQSSLFIWDGIPGASPSLTEDPNGATVLENAWVKGWPLVDCHGTVGLGAKVFNIWGRLRNCGIEIEAYDAAAFIGGVVDDVALPSADRVTEFDGLTIAAKYRGPVVAGMGLMNLFPARVVGNRPASRNLYLDLDLDITGEPESVEPTSSTSHGDQSVKINCVDGIYNLSKPLRLRGSRVGALNLATNGNCNVRLDADIIDAERGVIIGNSWNSLALEGTHDIDLNVRFKSKIVGAMAVIQQGHIPRCKVHIQSEGGGIELQHTYHERWAVSDQTGESWRLNTLVTPNGSATIVGWGDGYVIIDNTTITGTIQPGDAFTTDQGSGPAAGNGAGTLGAKDELDAITSAQYSGSLKGGRLVTPSPPNPRPACRDLRIDLDIDGVGESSTGQCSIGHDNQPVNDSRIRLSFTRQPIFPVINKGVGNVYEISSDNVGNPVGGAGATLLQDFGDRTTLLNPRIAPGSRITALYRKEGGEGLTVKGAAGPSTLQTYVISSVTGPIRGDRSYSVEFDLSGPATTIALERLANPVLVTSVEVFYPGGTSADAGVELKVGHLANTGYVTVFTSASNVSAGGGSVMTETGSAASGKILPFAVPAGQVLAASCAGGKVGADKAVLIIHVADL